MCFYIHPICPEPLVATEDIHCFKAVNRNRIKGHFKYRTPYQNYPLNSGDKLISQIETAPFRNEGKIEEGIHSCITIENAERHYSDVVLKAIIPKGSVYYFNPRHGEYVSDKLVIGKRPSWLSRLWREFKEDWD